MIGLRYFISGLSFLLLNFSSLAQTASLTTDTLRARQLLEAEKVLSDTGDYERAFVKIESARELYLRHELWEAAIRCEIRLSQLADNFDTADKKITHSDRAIDLATKYLIKGHPISASAFRQKAEALMMLGNLDSANIFLQQAIPIFENNKDWEELGWSQILIAVNHLNQYQLEPCAVHLTHVENLLTQQELNAEVAAEIRSTLLDLRGVLFQLQGDYDNAIKNTQEALSINFDKVEFSNLDSSFIAAQYNNLASFHFIKGDYQRAIDNYSLSKSYDLAAINNPVFLNNIGQLYLQTHAYQKAIINFEQSLLHAGKTSKFQHDDIDILNSLALCYKELGDYDRALDYCKKAGTIAQDSKGYTTWATLGSIYIEKKEPLKALEYLQKSTVAFNQDSIASKSNITYNSRLHYSIGKAHVLNDNPKEALASYHLSLITNHNQFKDSLNHLVNPPLVGIYDPIYFLDALHAKAKMLATFRNDLDYLQKALETYSLTSQWIDTLQASYLTEASQLDWSQHFKSIYEEAIQVAFMLYEQTNDKQYVDRAFMLSEKSKNAILLETLKSAEGQSKAGIPDSLIQKEKDLNIDIAFYQKSILKINNNEDAQSKLYHQYLSERRLEMVALKEQFEKNYPTYHQWKYSNNSSSIATIPFNLLDEKTALFEYFIGENSAFVFVITKNKLSLLPLSSPQLIQETLSNFSTVLVDKTSFKRNPKNAFKKYYQYAIGAYEQVAAIPLRHISKNITSLIIIPDGMLNSIPFEALCKKHPLTEETDFSLLPYLLYDFQIHYGNSAKLLLTNQLNSKHSVRNNKCLAFAPSYQEKSSIAQNGNLEQLRSHSGNLLGTAREIEQISHFFSGEFHIGSSATEHQFKSNVDQYGIIHLAMHGKMDLANANFNYLKFSDVASTSSEDNLLHHYEIANLNLNAQLVVLSACETGVGKYEKGEGVYSLARSFMYAGVPSVVMSMWKVSDESTSQIMPYFYEDLAQGQAKDQALRGAKLRFLKEANLEYRHPFYWSAFVVLGDTQSLHQPQYHQYWWIGGLVFVGLLLWLFSEKKRNTT